MAESQPRTQRWRAFFQQASEAVFLVNRHRRLLFVNTAWEKLTGVSAAQARGLLCGRRRSATTDVLADLGPLHCPPDDLLHGKAGQVRRRGVSASGDRPLWDIDFLPLHDDRGLLCWLGRIRVLPAEETPGGRLLPEAILELQARANRRHNLTTLTSTAPALRRVQKQVQLASQTRTPVLLVGEPGTGKHWVARTIHAIGARGAFAAIDAAGLPPVALTRLLSQPDGLLHREGMGTVYLREPAHLPRELQTGLAAWLEHAPERLGGPRLLAGCSCDPALAVQAGRLVEDLYCHLSPLVIHLTPLRERKDDLPALVERMLDRLRDSDGRAVTSLTPAAWEIVRSYSWPGNLRELYDVLAEARSHANKDRIDRGDLPANLRLAVTLDQSPGRETDRPIPLDAFLERAEKRLIELALRKARGNKSRAAELLAVWRPRLLRRMAALGLASPTKPATDDEPAEVHEILEEADE